MELTNKPYTAEQETLKWTVWDYDFLLQTNPFLIYLDAKLQLELR